MIFYLVFYYINTHYGSDVISIHITCTDLKSNKIRDKTLFYNKWSKLKNEWYWLENKTHGIKLVLYFFFLIIILPILLPIKDLKTTTWNKKD